MHRCSGKWLGEGVQTLGGTLGCAFEGGSSSCSGQAAGSQPWLRCPAGAGDTNSFHGGGDTHTSGHLASPAPGQECESNCHVIRDIFPESPKPDSPRLRRRGPSPGLPRGPHALSPPPPHHDATKTTCLYLYVYSLLLLPPLPLRIPKPKIAGAEAQ